MVNYTYYNITKIVQFFQTESEDAIALAGIAGIVSLVDSEDHFFIPGTNIIGVEI